MIWIDGWVVWVVGSRVWGVVRLDIGRGELQRQRWRKGKVQIAVERQRQQQTSTSAHKTSCFRVCHSRCWNLFLKVKTWKHRETETDERLRKLQEKKGSSGGFSGFKSGEGEFAENTLTCRFCECLIFQPFSFQSWILFLSFRRITVYLICSPRAGTPLWDGAILRHSNPTKFSKVIMTAKNVSEGELNIQNTDTLLAIKIRPKVLLCLFKITNWFLEN